MATVGLIYLGNFAEADTDETDFDNENDFVFDGTQGNTVLKALTAEVTTPDGDGIAYDDETAPPSQITYDLGAGSITATQDSVAVYNVSILLGDGTTLNTVVNVIQLVNGDTFVTENSNGAPLDGLSIQSITVGTLVNDSASGWYVARSSDGVAVVCFTEGTLIVTETVARPIETLRRGDRVETLDRGLQPVLWTHRRRMPALGAAGPMVIEAGALGAGIPRRRLVVSPQHRILLRSPVVERLCGAREVFVAAKHLAELPGCRRRESPFGVVYHHFMLGAHAVVLANGAPAETFFPGRQAIKTVSPRERAQIRQIVERHPEAAILCRPEAERGVRRRIVTEHLRTGQPLIAPLGGQRPGADRFEVAS